MNAMTRITTQPHRQSLVTRVEEIAPDARLRLEERCEHIVSVSEGVVGVALAEDDAILTPGEWIGIGAGERRIAWNAGDEAARVVVAQHPSC
jgi:quercetin dioxygenase-like cupin family protein